MSARLRWLLTLVIVIFFCAAPVVLSEPASAEQTESVCHLEAMMAPVTIELTAPEGSIAPGRTVNVRAVVTALADLTDLALTAQGRDGAVLQGIKTQTISSLAAGASHSFSIPVLYGDGDRAAVHLVAEAACGCSSKPIIQHGALFSIFQNGRTYNGNAGYLSIEQLIPKRDYEKGLITKAEYLSRLKKRPSQLGYFDVTGREALPVAIMPGRSYKIKPSYPQGITPLQETPLNSSGTVTVTGTVLFKDKYEDKNHAAHGVQVELWETNEPGGNDYLLAAHIIDAADGGAYTFTVDNDDGTGELGRDLYVKYVTKNEFVKVYQSNGVHLYEVQGVTHENVSDGATISEGTYVFSNGVGGILPEGQAASICVAATYAMEYIVNDLNDGLAINTLDVWWPSALPYSRYNGEVRRIYIASDDAYDWDTIHHEFGHFVMHEFGFMPLCGVTGHLLQECLTTRYDKAQGICVAWTEGWPTYFGTVGQKEMSLDLLGMRYVGDDRYTAIDIIGGSPIITQYSVEDRNYNPAEPFSRGEGNEVCVTRVLWDLYDTENDDNDDVSYSDNDLFDLFTSNYALSFHEFWTNFGTIFVSNDRELDLRLGALLSDHGFGPKPLFPLSGAIVTQAYTQFSWSEGVGCDSNGEGNQWNLKFFHPNTFEEILTVPDLTTTVYELTNEEFRTVKSGSSCGLVVWAVEGINTNTPETGPYLGEPAYVQLQHTATAYILQHDYTMSGYGDWTHETIDNAIEATPYGNELTYVYFGSPAVVHFPLTTIMDFTDRMAAHQAVFTSPAGLLGPSLGEAIIAACTELSNSDADVLDYVMITNGYNYESPNLTEGVQDPCFQDIPALLASAAENGQQHRLHIYHFANTYQWVDPREIERIARESGGSYRYISVSSYESDFLDAMVDFQAFLGGEQNVLSEPVDISPDGNSFPFFVSADMVSETVTLAFAYAGTGAIVNLEMPDGTIIDQLNIGDYPGIERRVYQSTADVVRTISYRLTSQPSGEWQVHINSEDELGEFRLQITTQSSVRMDASMERVSTGPKVPILLSAALRDGIQPIRGAQVQADFSIVDDDVEPPFAASCVLYDDGVHGDGEADDGVYANYFTEYTRDREFYEYQLTASGMTSQNEPFTRTKRERFYVENVWPVPNAGPDQRIRCEGGYNQVHLDASASYDPDGHPLLYNWWWDGGSLGLHEIPYLTIEMLGGRWEVGLLAMDPYYDSIDDPYWDPLPRDTMSVEIYPGSPPVFEVTPSHYVLWPPDHSMVNVILSGTIEDSCLTDPPYSNMNYTYHTYIDTIFSNEPDAGTSPEDLPDDFYDWSGVNVPLPFNYLNLRAERSDSGGGRLYTIALSTISTLEFSHGLDHNATDTVYVKVPKYPLYVASRGDTLIPCLSALPTMELDGFKITNLDNAPAAFHYSVTSEGPATLTDNGEPLSLSGTTLELGSMETFTPPAALLEVPEIHSYSQQRITYRVWSVDDPAMEETSTTNIIFEAAVAVTITNFVAQAAGPCVELMWDISANEALQGFRIYRSEQGSERWESISGSELIATNNRAYTDKSAKPGQRYRYQLSAVGADGREHRSYEVTVTTNHLGYELLQNYPNPFNPNTTIAFTAPQKVRARLVVYDTAGRVVRVLKDEKVSAGLHEVPWDGRDGNGTPVSSGVYLYRLQVGKQSLTKKMVLLK